jgi:phage shock protein A
MAFWRYLWRRWLPAPDNPQAAVQLAVEELQRSHREVAEAAAAVIGGERGAQMRLDRQVGEVKTLEESIRRAHQLADEARLSGDQARQEQYPTVLRSYTEQVKAARTDLEQTRAAYERMRAAAEEARRLVEESARKIQRKLMDRQEVLNALQHAKLEKPTRMPASAQGAGDTSRDWLRKRYPRTTKRLDQIRLAQEGQQ